MPANLLPPDELPDTIYPMVLSTGRVLEHWHTGAMTRRADVLDAIEPEAIAQLSPRELGRLGIRPGEMIRVETRRGAVEIKTRADRDVPEGMVFIPFCYAEAAEKIADHIWSNGTVGPERGARLLQPCSDLQRVAAPRAGQCRDSHGDLGAVRL